MTRGRGRRWMSPRGRVSVLLLAAVLIAGCGSSQTPKPPATTQVAAVKPAQRAAHHILSARHARAHPPATVLASTLAAKAARRACASTSAASALQRLLAVAKRAQARHPLPVRRTLIAQASRLPAAARRGPGGAAFAAALYAVSRPVGERPGAYAACHSAVHR